MNRGKRYRTSTVSTIPLAFIPATSLDSDKPTLLVQVVEKVGSSFRILYWNSKRLKIIENSVKFVTMSKPEPLFKPHDYYAKTL
ncbi:hypothetical protein KPH14_010898 [Odynerus spinipes]|uniref:Uncharacterized protein n=1 Tax=Odynerus spinipes TaxID=1348599 RepID=A0AAD9RH50_9HYME|nr:hypothetical protein KPH14_010898 [Odynerus spinipes]